MKKHIGLCLLLLLLGLTAASAQSGRSRPGDSGNGKKTGQPTPTPTPATAPAPNSPEITNGASTDGDEVVKVSTDVVSFPVSVFDRRGRYIFDLKKEEFQIFEDGKPQEVAFFATTEQPFTVVLMIDISRSTRFKITDIQTAAIAFVNQLRPDDKVMVVAFAENVLTLTDFTNDRDAIKRAIHTTRFTDGTSMYDAFKLTTERLQRVQGRKAIVMFTDGVDTTSRRSTLSENLSDSDELDAIIFPIEFNTYADVKRMERQGGLNLPDDGPLSIPGVVIDDDKHSKSGDSRDTMPPNPGTSPQDYQIASKYLADLAERTGGKVEKATTLYDIDSAFSRIAQGLRQQYSIGYYPPNIEKTGVSRKVKVKVTRPDLVVKARDTYTIGGLQKKKKGAGGK